MSTKIHSFDDFLALFPDKPRAKIAGGFNVICPTHNDRGPSLSVTQKDGKIGIYCHAGCATEGIVKEIGLTMADLFLNSHKPQPDQKEIEAVYHYTDAKGKPFEVVRTRPKSFYQRRPDGRGGYINDLKGIVPTLYHQDELLPALDGGELIYVAEGEKDTDRLRSLGFIATTNPMGAGKWRSSYSETLRGADLIIIPDSDEPGRKHANQVAGSCYGKAKRIRILELPAKDVSDWLDKDGGIKQLARLVNECLDFQPTASSDYGDAFLADDIKLFQIGNDPEEPRYELRDTREPPVYPVVSLIDDDYLSLARVRRRVFHSYGIIPFPDIKQEEWLGIIAEKADKRRASKIDLPDYSKEKEIVELAVDFWEQRGEGEAYSDVKSGSYLERGRGDRIFWWFHPTPLYRWLRRSADRAISRGDLPDKLRPFDLIKQSIRVKGAPKDVAWLWGIDRDKLQDAVYPEAETQQVLPNPEGEGEDADTLPDV